MEKILVTEKAKEVISQLKAQYGDLMFYMSDGCFEGSQPMCYEKGDYKPAPATSLSVRWKAVNFTYRKNRTNTMNIPNRC